MCVCVLVTNTLPKFLWAIIINHSSPMDLRYLVERIGQVVITIFTVVTLTFVLIRQMPGGPMTYLRNEFRDRQGFSEADADRMIELYTNINPEETLLEAYISYMTSILQGDLGRSLWQNEEVATVIAEALPWTVFLMSVSMFLSFGIGITVGALMAYFEGGKFDISMTGVSVVLTSIPYYVVAIVFIAVFAYNISLFPAGGRVGDVEAGFSLAYIGSVFHHATLPILSMVLTGFGGTALSMRGNSIQVLGQDYLRVARLRGLPTRTIALRYVGRNAVLPMYTGLMIGIGFMFGGSIILEEIFQYPGIGYHMFQSVDQRDYMLMMGCFIVITTAVAVSIFIADLTYGKIDPRAGSGGDEG